MTRKLARRWLGFVQEHATIYDDDLIPGSKILAIGDAPQSHVNLAHPEEVFYEYLARIANHLTALRPETRPLKMLHLGAGALTLVRWASVVYPSSTHVAVDIERELLDFVLTHLPLPQGCELSPIVADARSVLAEQLFDEKFDVIVLDIFSGPEAPEHLTTAAYYAELKNSLTNDGLLFVNIGDDPPLDFTCSQVEAARTSFETVMLSSSPDMFTKRFPGNMILTASSKAFHEDQILQCQSKGPFPSEVRRGMDLDGFCKP